MATTTRTWTVEIPAHGDPEVVEIRIPGDFLTQAQTMVGGYVESVAPLGLAITRYRLLVDEEGLLKEKPDNPIASYLYGSHLGSTPICGTAVVVRIVTDPETGEPDLAWLTCDEATRLHTQLLQMTGRVTA